MLAFARKPQLPGYTPKPLLTAADHSPEQRALPARMRSADQVPLFLRSQRGAVAPANAAVETAVDWGANWGAAKHRPKSGGEDEDKITDMEEAPILPSAPDVMSPAPSPAPGVTPPTPLPAAPPVTAPKTATPKHITPAFVLDKKEDPRSNSKPSTQSKSAPTFTGGVVGDGKVWRYELNSVESKGKIRIVYFTDDHYPAPTPTDDSGALSNVTKTNWKTIVDDLEKNKEGVPDFWSAYKAEDVHETYHWEVEWQGEMKKELVKAENDIALLSVSAAAAATAADAAKVLAPQAAKLFNDAMARADASYQALPDSPGAPAYKAQIPVVTALKDRVAAHAAANKW